MWATSIGSTLAHSPGAGERKSGIPDGTEIPAPVRATTESAARIAPASCTAAPRSAADGDTPPLTCRASGSLAQGAGSLAHEVGGALLEEGRNPLARVF